MFTGIVEGLGKVESLRASAGGTRRLTVKTSLEVGKLPIGASMAVNGACLTIVARRAGRPSTFQADVGPETLACTTLGSLGPGSRVHLEPALRLGDSLGGHMVSGHVDATGCVESARKQASTLALRVTAPEELAAYLFKKGSIAINGVSLTINQVAGASFEVLLIPHTLEVTLLGELRAGSRVNLEADMIAKQVARFVERIHAR
ncbi:MAG TPA: riboflavin synthase [Polyangia bacterium]